MRALAFAFVTAFALALTGCQSTPGTQPAPINTACPVQPDHDIDEDVTADFEGHTVAFCCNGCVDKFDEMSRDEKVAALRNAGADL